MKPKYKRIIFLCLLLMTALIGFLHYYTPGYMILYHDTYRRVSYFPITIGAILFGLPGGIVLAICSCLAFIPHLLMFWYQGPEAYYSELSEILFYLSAGRPYFKQPEPAQGEIQASFRKTDGLIQAAS